MAYSRQWWKDFRLTWTPSSYGGLSSLTVPRKKIWTPHIYLIDPANEMKAIGDDKVIARIHSDGSTMWSPGGLVQSLCDVDLYSFPFYTQTCSITLTIWGYYGTEAVLVPINNLTIVDTTFYNKNAQWDLKRATLSPLNNGGRNSLMKVQLTLQRLSLYFVINMLVPVFLLSVLNPLVFVLPVDSGERVSFAVTIFHSFAVFMTLIIENMPKSSEPMAAISFFLTGIMCLSTIIALCAILTLYLHFKESQENVSKRAVGFLRFLQLNWLCKKLRQGNSSNVVLNVEEDDMKCSKETAHSRSLKMDHLEKTKSEEIWNWKRLAEEYDKTLTYYFYVLTLLMWFILVMIFAC